MILIQRYVKNIISALLLVSVGICADERNPSPTLERGAEVFINKCALCHGDNGMGEGLIPLKIQPYPDTNLTNLSSSLSRGTLKSRIALGAKLDNISEFMPPMGDVLTWTELESVVDFVSLLLKDNKLASKKIKALQKVGSASLKEGLDIFETRCALCHGKSGEGNGRMAKIIKSPPPVDLTASRLPDDYLYKIIGEGGQGVGRSKQMPPWRDQLGEAQMESVVIYIKSLRD